MIGKLIDVVRLMGRRVVIGGTVVLQDVNDGVVVMIDGHREVTGQRVGQHVTVLILRGVEPQVWQLLLDGVDHQLGRHAHRHATIVNVTTLTRAGTHQNNGHSGQHDFLHC